MGRGEEVAAPKANRSTAPSGQEPPTPATQIIFARTTARYRQASTPHRSGGRVRFSLPVFGEGRGGVLFPRQSVARVAPPGASRHPPRRRGGIIIFARTTARYRQASTPHRSGGRDCTGQSSGSL